jgi:hypothetical protein
MGEAEEEETKIENRKQDFGRVAEDLNPARRI